MATRIEREPAVSEEREERQDLGDEDDRIPYDGGFVRLTLPGTEADEE